MSTVDYGVTLEGPMKVKSFTVYGHSDTIEGRGPMRIVARFTNEHAAREYVQSPEFTRFCVMGYAPTAKDVSRYIKDETIILYDSVQQLRMDDKSRAIASAKAKLTAEELKLLGIE